MLCRCVSFVVLGFLCVFCFVVFWCLFSSGGCFLVGGSRKCEFICWFKFFRLFRKFLILVKGVMGRFEGEVENLENKRFLIKSVVGMGR